MNTVIGVDGCKAGWVSCWLDLVSKQVTVHLHECFSGLLFDSPRASIIAVDVPIGLADGYVGRCCDALARKVLGARRNSVFTPPRRAALVCDDYRSACDVNRAACGKAMSQQAFHIMKKIREVDNSVEPALQIRVFEAHPEVSFWAMQGGTSMAFHKATTRGRNDRRIELERHFGNLPALDFPKRAVAEDDFFDALACTWTATRIADGIARLLTDNSRDSRGLRIAISY